VIGDFGDAGRAEADVAALVNGWNVDYIVTTGDNNYPAGEAQTIDQNIGQYYQSFIFPYVGDYGPGSPNNRFYPAIGNHDWDTGTLQPYLDYFTLPGNERYYELQQGPVQLFILDSDPNEPDGRSQDSIQAGWLEEQMSSATGPWQLVILHHAPYSSALKRRGDVEMQWPYAEWGADAVISGHDHFYERLERDGIPYIINGLGGRYSGFDPIHRLTMPEQGSKVRYNQDYGAMLVTAGDSCINFSFFTSDGELIDSYTLYKE
jgi:tartrate-resistant acid phosphatase type 5